MNTTLIPFADLAKEVEERRKAFSKDETSTQSLIEVLKAHDLHKLPETPEIRETLSELLLKRLCEREEARAREMPKQSILADENSFYSENIRPVPAPRRGRRLRASPLPPPSEPRKGWMDEFESRNDR